MARMRSTSRITSSMISALMRHVAVFDPEGPGVDRQRGDGQAEVDGPVPVAPLHRRPRRRRGDAISMANRAGGNVRRFSSRVCFGSGSSGRAVGQRHLLHPAAGAEEVNENQAVNAEREQDRKEAQREVQQVDRAVGAAQAAGRLRGEADAEGRQQGEPGRRGRGRPGSVS